MASSQSFEVAWGGNWNRAHRARWHGVAEQVTGFVATFTEDEEIEVHKPKRFTFCKRRPNSLSEGICEGPSNISIAVNIHRLARGEALRARFDQLNTGLHEAIHALRYERFPAEAGEDIDYPEHATHEGLAYVGCILAFRPSTSPSTVRQLAHCVQSLDRRAQFLTPDTFARNVDTMINDRHRAERSGHWMASRRCEQGLAESMGIIGVSTLIDGGIRFADILNMPAPDMLMTAADVMRST